jgi:hypothetical protein
MKNLFFILIITLLTSFTLPDNTCIEGCEKFKTGTFHITTPDGKLLVIKRDENFQYETQKEDRARLKYKVEWLNSCTYKLSYIKGRSKSASRKKLSASPDIIVKIVKIEGNSYYQETRFDGNPKVLYKGKMTKVD